MSLFTAPGLKLDFFDARGRDAHLIEEIRYELGHQGSGNWLVVEAGFTTDGATVPRPLWWFLPPWGSKASKAAIIHDKLIRLLAEGRPAPGYETRKAIDDEFYTALIAIGVAEGDALAAWAGIRAFAIVMGRT